MYALEIFHGWLLLRTSHYRMMYKQHGTTVILNLVPGDSNSNTRVGLMFTKVFQVLDRDKKDSGDYLRWGLITPL